MSTTIVNGVEIGPDGKEWAKTEAGDRFMCDMKARADGFHGGARAAPWYHGWALRHAFVAGAEWQEQRTQKPEEPSRLPAWVKEGAVFRMYDHRLYHVHGVVNGIAVLKEWWKHKRRWNYSCEDCIFFDVAEQMNSLKIVKKAK